MLSQAGADMAMQQQQHHHHNCVNNNNNVVVVPFDISNDQLVGSMVVPLFHGFVSAEVLDFQGHKNKKPVDDDTFLNFPTFGHLSLAAAAAAATGNKKEAAAAPVDNTTATTTATTLDEMDSCFKNTFSSCCCQLISMEDEKFSDDTTNSKKDSLTTKTKAAAAAAADDDDQIVVVVEECEEKRTEVEAKLESISKPKKRARAVTTTTPTTTTSSDNNYSKAVSSAVHKPNYIHVRARRGQATDGHSLAERARREKISKKMKCLQDLVPGCSNIIGKAGILDEIINYVQSLQRQVEFLSMKLATQNPGLGFNIDNFTAAHDQMNPGQQQVTTNYELERPIYANIQNAVEITTTTTSSSISIRPELYNSCFITQVQHLLPRDSSDLLSLEDGVVFDQE
ncbi:hypothetical protein LWI28_028457 [Acer negundo]|uniref:BHLH domain-containing protein n=1 Tax=Acer negundo TaxID=4023 RepID=A0AAD5NKX2_ACENE|nr:hypothetical protein LWI28_028457 [Acer negundo]KAK4840293.1 hypothetical protein QYF36_004954 [Acer negundo]